MITLAFGYKYTIRTSSRPHYSLNHSHCIFYLQKMNFKILILFVATALVAFVSQTKAASLDEPFEHEIGNYEFIFLK